MTKEEAKIIIGNIPIPIEDCYTITEYQEAKTEAIKALEQQSIPTADVIEREEYNKLIAEGFLKDCESCESNLRSKIDKAIGEIENKIHKDPYLNHTKAQRTQNDTILEVLEILKRNIGELYNDTSTEKS